MGTTTGFNSTTATGLSDAAHHDEDHGSQIFKSVAGFFASVDHAINAASDYESLSRLSDGQLEKMGLTRETLGQHIISKHLRD